MMPQNYYMSSGMNNQMMMPQYDPMSGIAQCVKVHFFVQKFKLIKILFKKLKIQIFEIFKDEKFQNYFRILLQKRKLFCQKAIFELKFVF